MTDMKTKIAIALSLIGVLGAGSAAALVNTQILDGAVESGASKAVLPPASTIELSVPDAAQRSDAIGVEVPDPSSTTTTAPTTTIAATPASDRLTSFEVGEAGVVTVDVLDGVLVLASAEPMPGWTVTKAEDDSNDDSSDSTNEVEVEFRSATIEVEFEAVLIDGRIVPKVESSFIGGSSGVAANNVSTTIAGSTGPTTTVDDD
ncbi:MAG: hypothetical protein CL424_00815, partial [Acidimicrobiaceae bacterium]|nr:hypothetical protein [Acidimicrobiaceae bacterium]